MNTQPEVVTAEVALESQRLRVVLRVEACDADHPFLFEASKPDPLPFLEEKLPAALAAAAPQTLRQTLQSVLAHLRDTHRHEIASFYGLQKSPEPAKDAQSSATAIAPPDVSEGEIYVGTLISADGARCEHLILLPGEFEGAWQESLAWAESIGGQLPDRVEGALLFAHAKSEFEPKWYWTREQHAANSDCAWCQDFSSGYQHHDSTFTRLRARAVRRSPIQSFGH